MRLSDIKGERTFDVIAEIIEPVANIAADKTATELFAKKVCPEGVTPHEFAAGRLKKAAPVLLKEHKRDLMHIMAAIEGVPVEEYEANLNLVKLMNDAVELLNDDAFKALFF